MAPNPKVTLQLDSNQFLAGIAKARAGMTEMEVQAKGQLGSAMSAVEKSFGRVASSSGGLVGNLTKVGQATGIASDGALVMAVGATAVGAVMVKVGESSAKAFVSLGNEMFRFQNLTGANAEETSMLVNVFRTLGVDSDGLSLAFKKLGTAIEQHPEKLASYGVAVAKSKNGTTDLAGTLLNLGDAFRTTADPAERLAMINDLLGRGGQKLIPILSQNRQVLEDLAKVAKDRGEFMSQSDIDKAHEFSIQANLLGESMKAAGVDIGRGLVPELTDLAAGLNRVGTAADGALKHVGGLGGAFKSALSIGTLGTSDFVAYLGRGSAASKTAALEADKLKQKIKDQTDAMSAQADAVQKSEQAVTSLDGALKSAASAEDGYKTALETVNTDTGKVADARAKYNTLLRAGVIDTSAVASAEKDLTSAAKATESAMKRNAGAIQSVADAQAAVVTAEQALAKVQQGSSPEDIGKAELAVAAAKRGETQAALDSSKANMERIAVISDSKSTMDDIAQANLRFQDSMDAEKQAAYTTTDAQKALTDAQNAGKPGADDYKQAQDGVKTATDNVAKALDDARQAAEDLQTAQDAQVDAQAKLDAAQLPSIKMAQDIAAAKKDLTDQESALAKAKGDVNDKDLAMVEAKGKLLTASQDDFAITSALVAKYQELAQQHPELKSTIDPFVAALSGTLKAPAKTSQGDLIRYGGAFADGGIVPGRLGEPMLITAHGGEEVSKAGASGATNLYLTLNGVSVFDSAAADRLADRIVPALRRRADRGGLAA